MLHIKPAAPVLYEMLNIKLIDCTENELKILFPFFLGQFAANYHDSNPAVV